jgi:integrase
MQGGIMGSPFMESVRHALRVRHYAYSTEKAYLGWVRAFIRHCGRRHPRELGAEDVRGFLTWLAVERRVAPSTQNQALSAILFLYRHVLEVEPPWVEGAARAKHRGYVPTVLTSDEVRALLDRLSGTPRLIADLLYGSGMRRIEALRLRVCDVDFEYRRVIVRSAKGAKDRVTIRHLLTHTSGLPAFSPLWRELRGHAATAR